MCMLIGIGLRRFDMKSINLVKVYESCGCIECDCAGYSFSVRLNGESGHGSGYWVLGEDGDEVLYFRTTVGEFFANHEGEALAKLHELCMKK